jgi:hypothetical protein
MDQPFDLTAYDAKHTLASLVDVDRSVAQGEADKLAHLVHFCDLHPVVDPDDEPATWPTDQSLVGPRNDCPICGPGTPTVTVEAVHELTAALGISHGSGLNLVGQTLELRYRLPILWGLVQDLTMPAWQGRQVAEHTMTLSREAAAFVDRHLAVAVRAGKFRLGMIAGAVQLAIARCDPDKAEQAEENALAGPGVWFERGDTAAVTYVSATLDTLQALALNETVSKLATTLGRLGDTTSRDVRRATALGMLADPQAVLDLDTEEPARQPVSTATLYVHVDTDTGTDGATVEGIGAGTRTLIGDWLDRTDHVKVQPVLDLSRTDAVDRHDPPGWMRELVVLRDATCVFPGCRIDARRCDLDHLVPYDDTGPPGQTSPGNLAALCRRHHNAKTHRGWRYERTATGYEWTSPLGRSYTVPR